MNIFRHIRYIAFAAVVLTALGAGARDAAQWLVSAPANVLSGVPRNTRLDALDYYNSGVSRDVAADDHISVRITRLTPQAITMRRGSESTIQIAALPAGRDTLLAVIYTIDKPTAISSISFYDRDWQPAAKQPFTMPGFTDWIASDADADVLQATLGFIPATAEFSATADSLVITNTGAENARLNGVEGDLKSSIVFTVKKAKFSPAK